MGVTEGSGADRPLRTFAQWMALGALVGAACGVASAAFLALLGLATDFREAHRGIVYALPLAGLGIGAIYERWGTPIRGGNNLVIDTIHDGSAQLPLRMAPMVLVGTVLTHLFGGSAGREGTAVQMGASLADAIAHRFGARRSLRRIIIAAGIAGGFGSVFGTPLAGLVFGLEVLAIGRLEYEALVPALVASIVGDRVTRGLGIVHTVYPTLSPVAFSAALSGKLLLMAGAMALATVAFIELTHFIKAQAERRLPRLPLRMLVGGAAVVVLWRLVGSDDYLGLGVPTILRACWGFRSSWARRWGWRRSSVPPPTRRWRCPSWSWSWWASRRCRMSSSSRWRPTCSPATAAFTLPSGYTERSTDRRW
jgi:H+/Cl- antiporter ClcA